MRILGRDPAFWLGLAGALVAAFSAFVLHLSIDQQGAVGAVAAVVVGLITAAVTRDGVVAAIVGFVKALFLLMVSFGLHVSAANQAVVYTLLAAVAAGYVRTQVIAPVGPAAPSAPLPPR